ncbi:cell wall metabolism sensor histidine kinase WalK [Paenibacillus sp. L3-i20]|uniref:sensor histidine kinase n=1 Tax=Paenibacillus sp. L3-i20 TaxID=2905833 RepID=UPI001EDF11FA|nr:HAMP domain-containing sensor histidine kinase [Paenibacillus sp. L3-i20]GKU78197.1 hypothetical protein L3i20_v225940 [Paenibacillus sp. L3-i20]
MVPIVTQKKKKEGASITFSKHSLLIVVSVASSFFVFFGIQYWQQQSVQRELIRAELFWNGYAKLYVEANGNWDGFTEQLERDRYMYAGDPSLSLYFYRGEMGEDLIASTKENEGSSKTRKIAVLSQEAVIGYTEVRLERSIDSIIYASVATGAFIYLIVLWLISRNRKNSAKQQYITSLSLLREMNQTENLSHLSEIEVGSMSITQLATMQERAQSAHAAVIAKIREMASKIEKLETVRQTMVADIAHELRTPIAIMRTQLDSAIGLEMPLSMTKMLTLHDETLRLTRLVHDLQELSLAESGNLPLFKSWFSLSELAEEVLEILSVEGEERNIRTEWTSFPQVRLYADRNRIKGVLINLIGNAFHYTRSFVSVTVRLNEHNNAEFLVVDDGWGIEEEDLAKVFERFYRGKVNGTRKGRAAGLGLGLAIVKEIVTVHGGTVSVDSVINTGTTFQVIIPIMHER